MWSFSYNNQRVQHQMKIKSWSQIQSREKNLKYQENKIKFDSMHSCATICVCVNANIENNIYRYTHSEPVGFARNGISTFPSSFYVSLILLFKISTRFIAKLYIIVFFYFSLHILCYQFEWTKKRNKFKRFPND